MQFNIQKLNATVEAAKAKAPEAASKIDAAAENLLCNPFIHDTGDGLLILSDSGNTYFAKSVGNVCNCKAHEFHMVCWHRLADRLVRLYNAKQRGN